jgi:hypothetical protein
MPEEISGRLAAVVKRGRELVDRLRGEEDEAWIDDSDLAPYEAWLIEVGELLLSLSDPELESFREFRRILASQRNPAGLKTYVVRRVFDLTFRVLEQHSQGPLRRIEDIVVATTYDDFLDDAARLLSAGREPEAAALACTVLSHALRRIVARRRAELRPDTLADLVTALEKIDGLEPEHARAFRAHAKTCELVLGAAASPERAGDPAELIARTRKLIGDYL